MGRSTKAQEKPPEGPLARPGARRSDLANLVKPGCPDGREALACFRNALQQGRPWPQSLLATIGRWPLPEEEVQGVHYRYLLLGEAFDWLVLAERLLGEVDGLVPAKERDALLFQGHFPEEMPESEFRSFLGPEKYRGHLNYFYGVVVEQALQSAVEEEVWKERMAQGLLGDADVTGVAYQRVYSAMPDALLRGFQKERGLPRRSSISLTEWKEFTYWLFKRRTSSSDAARVASDTKKGLDHLFRLRLWGPGGAFPSPST